MVGGFFASLLAMMRLSKFRCWRSPRRCEPHALVAAGAGDLLVLLPGPLHRRLIIGAKDRSWLLPSAAITFTMFEAAYCAEIMRAGIQSVARGQVWAGYALGLNYWQTMGRIVLPQAFRNMLPVLLTQTIILFQDTSLVYVISATDFLGAASKVANRDYRLVEMYTFVAVVYFVISFGLSSLVKHLQARIAIIR
jgi:glutamate/aspartate transport system permease protein